MQYTFNKTKGTKYQRCLEKGLAITSVRTVTDAVMLGGILLHKASMGEIRGPYRGPTLFQIGQHPEHREADEHRVHHGVTNAMRYFSYLAALLDGRYAFGYDEFYQENVLVRDHFDGADWVIKVHSGEKSAVA